VSDTKTWKSAQSFCHGNGGYLAEPINEVENDFIKRHISRENNTKIDLWLGGNDISEEAKWI